MNSESIQELTATFELCSDSQRAVEDIMMTLCSWCVITQNGGAQT